MKRKCDEYEERWKRAERELEQSRERERALREALGQLRPVIVAERAFWPEPLALIDKALAGYSKGNDGALTESALEKRLCRCSSNVTSWECPIHGA